jgi:hypothetical protein
MNGDGVRVWIVAAGLGFGLSQALLIGWLVTVSADANRLRETVSTHGAQIGRLEGAAPCQEAR